MRMLDAARALTRRGFFVFPCYAVLDAGTERARCSCKLGPDCGSPGKHPIGNTSRGPGEGGVKVATRDERKLREWWGRWPTLNPAVRTGVGDRVVLDLDGALGFESIAKLEGELGKLPATLTARSGRAEGGAHFWFTSRALASLGSRKIAPGLDFKGAGGYVVAPGARHKSGTLYAWTSDARVAQLPPAWEAWALKTIEEKLHREQFERPRFAWAGDPSDRVGKLLAKLACAPEGSRNDTLNEITYTLAGLCAGGQADDVRERVFETAMQCGLDERETRATIKSAWTKGYARPIMPRTPQSSAEDDAVTAAIFKKNDANDANDTGAGEAPAAQTCNRTRHDGSTDGSGTLRAAPLSTAPVRSVPAELPWERLERLRASARPSRAERLREQREQRTLVAKKKPEPERELPQCVVNDLARVADDAVALVVERGLSWDDTTDGAREVLAKAVAGVLVQNDVSLLAATTLYGMVDRRMEDREPGTIDSLSTVAGWAMSTLKRELRGKPNFASRALLAVFGEEPGARFLAALTAAARSWALSAPLDQDLSAFERERLEHARKKREILYVLEALDESGQSVSDDVRKTLAAAIHCGDYCQVHRAECCDSCYGKTTRVCELFWCSWCGARSRAERVRMAREIWASQQKSLDVVIFHVEPGHASEMIKLRRHITKQLGKVVGKLVPFWRWFEVPEKLIFVCASTHGGTLSGMITNLRHLADVQSFDKIPPESAVAIVQKAWHERANHVTRQIAVAAQCLKIGERGDEKSTERGIRLLRSLSEDGWLRDLRWHGSNEYGNERIPWPTRDAVREALKERAARERAKAGRGGVSSKPPEFCPAHRGRVVIDVVHVPSKRVVVAGLRNPVALLDAVRLDVQRLTNVPAKKQRELSETEREVLAYSQRLVAARYEREAVARK